MGTDGELQTNVKKYAVTDRPEEDKWSYFVWNPKTGAFFGRTGISWIKIFVFYVIFYACLAAFAWFCYYLFSLTLHEDRPKWILDSSLIGTNPGVGFRPMPDQEENSGSSLIWYKRDDEKDVNYWVNRLQNFINETEEATENANLEVCSYDQDKQASKEASCRVDLEDFKPNCTKANKYGYAVGEPCIAIKLNRIFGWEPEPFGLNKKGKYDKEQLDRDLDNQPEMPKWLKDHIRTEATSGDASSLLNTIWVSCGGENIADRETIGSVQYRPRPGIPGYYFPYYRQTGYQSPFIFIQLLNPRPGVLINIECRAWANNIIYDKHNRLGSVHLEMMID